MAYPTEYRYTKEHEWIAADGRIGITDYAQSTLGDIVFVELPAVGAELKAGESFGTVESVKAVSDLYSPVNGKVLEVNEALNSAPESVNADANATWMIKAEFDASQLESLLTAEAYEKFISEETGH
ncbi:MAG: glycine cleavage system protein GcvH [Acidobacteriaceae bacterium]|jgi:glycine cleavage system H protein|nr:glycine cleavage system protein GcvH [Acidobacteriota bacterium]NUQ31091.1 glycine cleavage system protein GcvH [Acidobacteriaceae bacterium]